MLYLVSSYTISPRIQKEMHMFVHDLYQLTVLEKLEELVSN